MRQTPEDKVGFLPFSIIKEKLTVRKESQRRGGQEDGQERVDRQGSIVGRARGGLSCASVYAESPHLLPSPPSRLCVREQVLCVIVCLSAILPCRTEDASSPQAQQGGGQGSYRVPVPCSSHPPCHTKSPRDAKAGPEAGEGICRQ